MIDKPYPGKVIDREPDKYERGHFGNAMSDVIGDAAYELIPRCLADEVAVVYAQGERKYGRDNWKNGNRAFLIERVRHIHNHWNCFLDNDETRYSRITHLAKVIWGCTTLIWYERHRSMSPVCDLSSVPEVAHDPMANMSQGELRMKGEIERFGRFEYDVVSNSFGHALYSGRIPCEVFEKLLLERIKANSK